MFRLGSPEPGILRMGLGVTLEKMSRPEALTPDMNQNSPPAPPIIYVIFRAVTT